MAADEDETNPFGFFVRKLTNPTLHWNTETLEHPPHSLEHIQQISEEFLDAKRSQHADGERHSLGADTQTTGGSSFAAGRFIVRTTHKRSDWAVATPPATNGSRPSSFTYPPTEGVTFAVIFLGPVGRVHSLAQVNGRFV